MSPSDDSPAVPHAPAGLDPEPQALQDALAALMAPVAQLAVARGLPYAVVEELLKQAFVQAASAAHAGLLAHRKVSRISTSTGINRREVTRLTLAQPRAAARARSVASEVFTHWRTQPPYRARNGQPRMLPRQGVAPSFESLAQTITRDVHPRSLLDELCRLGLARWDPVADTVALARDVFVPQGDRVRKLGFLGDNVGDHLRAAVANVLADAGPPGAPGGAGEHFEQAVFADGLSAASLASVRPAIRAQWQALMAALVPTLEARVAADSTASPPPQGRLRVGLYTYQEDGAAPAPATAVDDPRANPPATPRPTALRASKRKP